MGRRLLCDGRCASVISKLNHALTILWPQLIRDGEPVELSKAKAEELVDSAVSKLRAAGEQISEEFRSTLLWHLTCQSM